MARAVWIAAALGAAIAGAFGPDVGDLRDAILEVGVASVPLLFIPWHGQATSSAVATSTQSLRLSASRRNCCAFLAIPPVIRVHTDCFRSAGRSFSTAAIAIGTERAVSSIFDHRSGSGRDRASLLKCRAWISSHLEWPVFPVRMGMAIFTFCGCSRPAFCPMTGHADITS